MNKLARKASLSLAMAALAGAGTLAAPRAARADLSGCIGTPGSTTTCCWDEKFDDLGSPGDADVWQSPSIVTSDGGQTRDVFIEGWDNAVWTRHHDGVRWSDWSSLGGVVTSHPTAVATGTDHLYVFARGGDYALWYREKVSGAWSAWRSMGGWIQGGPAAAAWSNGNVEVSVVGGDRALWVNSVNGASVSGWVSKGGTLYGEPAAVARAGATLGNEQIEHWVVASDMQLWRIVHTHRAALFYLSTDTWGAWSARMSGVTGAPGFVTNPTGGDPTSYTMYVHDAVGTVWWRMSSSTGDGDFHELPMITPWADLSAARDTDTEPEVAYVDNDTRRVVDFSFERLCATCGDGVCDKRMESCSSCPGDCGACPPSCGDGVCNGGESCSTCPRDCGVCVNACQDYKFCASGTNLTGHGCTIAEARSDAMRKIWGSAILVDGPCAPASCGGSPGWVVEWCCKTTGTTYFGAACTQADADAAAHVDSSCTSWQAGICD
jgi:hypothetical protein